MAGKGEGGKEGKWGWMDWAKEGDGIGSSDAYNYAPKPFLFIPINKNIKEKGKELLPLHPIPKSPT